MVSIFDIQCPIYVILIKFDIIYFRFLTIKVMSYVLGKTYTHLLANISFDTLTADILKTVFKDGRVFSHLIEVWVAKEYNITHIKGCRGHDFVCGNNGEIKIVHEELNYFVNNYSDLPDISKQTAENAKFEYFAAIECLLTFFKTLRIKEESKLRPSGYELVQRISFPCTCASQALSA